MQLTDYHKVITKPMDLTTMLAKIDDYTADGFVEDVRQMLFNSFDYNKVRVQLYSIWLFVSPE